MKGKFTNTYNIDIITYLPNLIMNKRKYKTTFKFKNKFTIVYGYLYIRTMNTEPKSNVPMHKDKQNNFKKSVFSYPKEDLCHIILESHQAYQEDVIDEGMTFDEFIRNFFGIYTGFFCDKGYKEVSGMFMLHQPIIEHRFKSSVFNSQDALALLQEFEHCNSFFDRSLIDIQLKSIIPKLKKDGIMPILIDCVNTTAMFHYEVDQADMMSILTGTSIKDYGIYNVSHFAYFMKNLEKHAVTIQHWQSMVWNLSRIVYKGRYLGQHLISSTVHNITTLKRRPWQYDEIDNCMHEIKIQLR